MKDTTARGLPTHDPLLCPICGKQGMVIDTRGEGSNYRFRFRRRECTEGHRWNSYEVYADELKQTSLWSGGYND